LAGPFMTVVATALGAAGEPCVSSLYAGFSKLLPVPSSSTDVLDSCN